MTATPSALRRPISPAGRPSATGWIPTAYCPKTASATSASTRMGILRDMRLMFRVVVDLVVVDVVVVVDDDVCFAAVNT